MVLSFGSFVFNSHCPCSPNPSSVIEQRAEAISIRGVESQGIKFLISDTAFIVLNCREGSRQFWKIQLTFKANTNRLHKSSVIRVRERVQQQQIFISSKKNPDCCYARADRKTSKNMVPEPSCEMEERQKIVAPQYCQM